MSSKVAVLITWDIEPLSTEEIIRERLDVTKTPEELLKDAVTSAINLIEQFDIETTFFVTARAANTARKELSKCIKIGCEIGNHGLNHTVDESYDRMPADKQYAYIERSTKILENIFKTTVNVFRAPRVKIGVHTMHVLQKLNYIADSSVCSFRIDFISSSISMPRAIFAPRIPYYPSATNPFEKGSMQIIEIPVSAYIIPFISASLNIFGLKIMKKIFKKLYKQSMRTGAPIVYLCHPTQFFANPARAYKIPSEWYYPSKKWLVEGLPFRHILFRTDGMKMFENTKKLFAYISEFSGIEFLSMKKFVYTIKRQEITYR